MSAYSEKLRDPRWQRKRLEILSISNFSCQNCGATDKPLHVHHGYYEKGAEPWEYGPDTLHPLCEDCHAQAEVILNKIHYLLGQLPFVNDLEQVEGYLEGLLVMSSAPNFHLRADTYCRIEGIAHATEHTFDEVRSLSSDGFVDGLKL